MQLGKGINNCPHKIETLKGVGDNETEKMQETLKIASFKDISRVKIFREGYIFLKKCFQSPDHQKLLDVMEEQGKGTVRHHLIFQRLATGEEQLKSFSSGYLDQCETQLRDLSLCTLLSIRIAQPDFVNAPDSLQRHARFTQTIDQILAEKVADYFLNVTCYQNSPIKCPDEPLFELFDISQEKKPLGLKGRRNHLINVRKKNLGYEIMFVLGITSFLSKFSEQHVRATMNLLVSENIQFHTTWWRFVLPVSSSVSQSKPCFEKHLLPTSHKENFTHLNSKYLVDKHFKKTTECFENSSTATLDLFKPSLKGNLSGKVTQPNALSLLHSSSERTLGKTTSFIYESSKSNKTNNMITNGRLAMQRSRSVDAVNRELLKGGTQLMNLFVKIPELYLTTQRPLTSDIFLCQNTNWAECQTIGQLTTAASDTSLRNTTQFGTLYVFKLSPTASLDRFIRPMDAAQALRQELQGVVLSRNGTSHLYGHSQEPIDNFSSIVKECPKNLKLEPFSLVRDFENQSSPCLVNSSIPFKNEKTRNRGPNNMITLDPSCMTEPGVGHGLSGVTNGLSQDVTCEVENTWHLKQRLSGDGPSISLGLEESEHGENKRSKDHPTYLEMDLLCNNSCQEQKKLSNALRRSHDYLSWGYLYKYKTHNPNTMCLIKDNVCDAKNFGDITDLKKNHIPTFSSVDISTPKASTKKETNVLGDIKKTISTKPATLRVERNIHGSCKRPTFSFSNREESKEAPKTSIPQSKELTFEKAPSLYYKNILSQTMLSPSIHLLAKNNLHSPSNNSSCASSVIFTQKTTKNAKDEESPLKENRLKHKVTEGSCPGSDVVLRRLKKPEEIRNSENLHKKGGKEYKPQCNLKVFSLRQLTECHYLPKSLSKKDTLAQDDCEHNKILHKNKMEYASKLKLPKSRIATSTLSTENSVTPLPNSNKLSDLAQRRVFHCTNSGEGEKKFDLHLKSTPLTFMSKISQFPKSYVKTTMSATRGEKKLSTKDKEHIILEKAINRMGVIDIPSTSRVGVSLQKTQPFNDLKYSSTKSASPVLLHQNGCSPFDSLPDCKSKKSVTPKNQSFLLGKKTSIEKGVENQCFTGQLMPSRWDHWRYRSNNVLGLLFDKTFENQKFSKKSCPL